MQAKESKMSLRSTVFVVTATLIMSSAVATAEDRFPPAWRGDAGSTFQHWDFPAGNPDGPEADFVTNDFGTPALTVQGEAAGGATWISDHLGNSAWRLDDAGGGRLDFQVANAATGQDQKTVRVQLTYAEGSVGSPLIRVVTSGGGMAMLNKPPKLVSLGNGYVYHMSIWRLPTCEQTESVLISAAGGPGGGGSTYIDQIVIDTICGAQTPCCNADTDNSGGVNATDLICVVSGLTDPAACPSGDVNCDGSIDGCDVDAALCLFMSRPGCCAPCPGACCVDGNTCTVSTLETCEAPPPFGLGGVYLGDDTSCTAANAMTIVEPSGEVTIHVIGPPIDCRPGAAVHRAGVCSERPLFDPWESPASGLMCHNFGVTGSPAIPADFFGPGSEPFTGTVCLEGVPLGPTAFGDFGDADTLVSRSADPFDAAAQLDLPGLADPVSIEVVALSLIGVSPITVEFNGGATTEDWNVAVDLSVVAPQPGSLTAIKTHCNGGTYTSTMNVQPRFTFSRAGDSDQVLDTGLEGIPPITLVQDISAPWSHNVGDTLGLMGDPCSDFHPGVQDAAPEFTSCAITQAPGVIETVPVGDPGNIDDRYGDGYGGVGYRYNIGKYEVTNAQYCEFLNAVGASDTNALYSSSMTSSWGGITQDGSDGSFTYATIAGRENMPVNYVSWYDGLRFANWIQNGQPTGAQDEFTTEDGAYDMSLGVNVIRKSSAQVFLPSEDEWYKAAYYKGGGLDAGYWDYATKTNDPDLPMAEAPAGTDMSNGSANYDNAVGNLTEVGAYTAKPSESAYHTFDQGGNVLEWDEEDVDGLGSYRMVRGGAFNLTSGFLRAAVHLLNVEPEREQRGLGFRLATMFDCNDNGVPDECDSDCGATFGKDGWVCSDVYPTPACGQSTDSDADGVPDECDTCPGYDDAEPCPIPAVSDWGLIAMTLLVLAGGTVIVARRRLGTAT